MGKIKREYIVLFILISVVFICTIAKNDEAITGDYKIIYNSTESISIAEDDLTPVITSIRIKETDISQTTSSKNIVPAETTSAAAPLYININTADVEELSQLDGIGEVLAGRIVDYREMYGDFRNVDEIKYVYGIGDGIFSAIYPYIYVEDQVYDNEVIPDPDEAEYEDDDPSDESYEDPEPNEPQLSLEDVIPVDLNTADAELLMLLPYVTEDIANKIIKMREEIGGYSHPYEIYYIGDLEENQVDEISKYVIARK